MKKNTQRAFTLLELLVVIAIIGILISLGVASFSNAQIKARDSRRREDMKAIQNGLEQYYADHDGTYPNNAGAVITSLTDVVNTYAGTTYFPAGAPVDPKVSNPGYAIASGPDGFCVCASLETPTGGNAVNAPGASTSCSFGNGTWFCLTNLQ
jgi:prepilin-type N-terminal cleavage/methylation domain-containing protein